MLSDFKLTDLQWRTDFVVYRNSCFVLNIHKKHFTYKYVPLAPDEFHAVDERCGIQSDLRPQGTEPEQKFADFFLIFF